MTPLLFDDGDKQRLTREETLTEQAPRIPAEPDRSPIEEDSDVELMLDALAELLQRRL